MYCPQTEFVGAFNAHCIENNLGKQKFNQDFYQGPFGMKDIEVRVETAAGKVYQGRVYPRGTAFIYGLDLCSDTTPINE